MGTSETIEYCIESMRKINENRDKSFKNLFDENIRQHKEIMAWRYGTAILFVAGVMAYVFVGE